MFEISFFPFYFLYMKEMYLWQVYESGVVMSARAV